MFKTFALIGFGIVSAQGPIGTTTVPACQGKRVRESVRACHEEQGNRDCWIVNWNNNCVMECEMWLTSDQDNDWFKVECLPSQAQMVNQQIAAANQTAMAFANNYNTTITKVSELVSQSFGGMENMNAMQANATMPIDWQMAQGAAMNSTVGQFAQSPTGQVFLNETAAALQKLNIDTSVVDTLFSQGDDATKFNNALNALESAVVGSDTDGTWAGLFGAFRQGMQNTGLFRKGDRNGQ